MVVLKKRKRYGFSRNAWGDFVKTMNLFCEYEDYNWDVCAEWMPTETFGLLGMQQSQVVECPELSECSVQLKHGGEINNDWDVVPMTLKHHELAPRGESGGWSDPRDVQLCKIVAGQP